jgi:hypothetical protein
VLKYEGRHACREHAIEIIDHGGNVFAEERGMALRAAKREPVLADVGKDALR